ncbi:T9SS type B sorting domain-containing protein [Tamlana fucoidanivorans]|uniref:T9SS type B sorting domain-containing protein n=1 Tax=Allotamlana fucoidanivorans TaxID=2583814 RepID=A0A5C4SI79_9FLAO|nr:choice-of-anchor L domain-containing protein [Tamlana fucoidanivorans]TNJ43190.1 T9SS type B sorting domain-containing protein [Tamlana fucoidanivorans]
MRFVYYVICILLCLANTAYSQQISVNDGVDLETLIQDNLVDGCVDISNITSSVNGASSGFSSYGYFERGNSNFPFENGIMLSTGAVASGGNTEQSAALSDGSASWGSDPDLETALGTTNGYVNATAIEFDFVSISNQFQFNYLLASEEYYDTYPCQFSDGFVFLIKEAGTNDPYQNIALIPGTSIPVNTNTIHDEIFGICPPENEQYFEGYGIGDTNYNGRTTILTASGTIQPNVTYHIKLIIADQTDSLNGGFDSAVFIEGDSFRVLDLGEDVSTCSGSVTLNADINNPLASYVWYRDNTVITGSTSSSFIATQNGTYRVEVTVPVNGNDCVETDEITVVLNTEEAMNPLLDFELCDDASGDQIETFDLNQKNSEVLSNAPFSNPLFSYHYSETEARSNQNPITSPIQNTTNPQTIFIRIEDRSSGCFAFSSFNLVVNSRPSITPPSDLDICDADEQPDGRTDIDLTEKNDEITSGDSNLRVTYHYTAFDASNGNNPISMPYRNTNTPSDQVFARVINSNTGCTTTTTLNINITTSPIVNREPQYLNACDSDLNGNAFFDLTEVLPAILGGLTQVTPTFHSSISDAEAGINPITNVTNYEYTNGSPEPGFATLYLRVLDDNTQCASVIPFEIHTNLLLTGTDIGDFALCDNDTDSTNSLDFNLFTVESSIANNLDTPNGLPNSINVTFYQSESDRNNGTNALDKSQLYAALSPSLLYITIDDGSCIQETEITLLINPILLFNNVVIPYCDNDDDGITSIDLESLDGIITGGNTNFTVSYFANQVDADNNNTSNQLPRYFVNDDPVETLYARITSLGASGCSTVNPFRIEVFTAPTTTEPTNIVVCDDDQDGISIVNLNNKISEIVSSTSGLDIDFFTTYEDADNKTNEIPESERTAYTSNTQTIYTRVEDIVSGTNCYAIVPFEVIVNTLPIIPTITDYKICEPSGTSVSNFTFSEKDNEILNGQAGKEVFYFEDSSFTMPIDKESYQNTSSPQTIYVRVENSTDASCFETASFTILVSPNPIYNAFSNYTICDDDSNDGKHLFNLDEKAQEIRQGMTDDLTISFHETFDYADNNLNPVNSSYTNITNPQTLYVRIENNNSLCHVIEELGINILAAPNITEASDMMNCDADYDGITNFDLTTANFQILDRVQSNLIINYFENFEDINQEDGLDNSNEITNPTNFISETQTVYIKVANTLTTCFSVIPLNLVVNIPPEFNIIGTIDICDNPTNTYDLSLVDNRIVNNLSLVTISYHETIADAQNNTAPLNRSFNYTSNQHTFFVRISNNLTGCPIITSFTLNINPNPVAYAPSNLVYCDDNTNQTDTLIFNLLDNENDILGSQNSNDFTVSFHQNLEDASDNLNPLNTSYAGYNQETIFARVENNTTECYDVTSFNLTINPIPNIAIEDIVPLCNNFPVEIIADTGFPDDIYEWSTGETTPSIVVQPSDLNSGRLDLWVHVTRPYITGDCENNKTFTVLASDEAEINLTSTVNFSDPNSITVEINNNRIGNYVFILDGGTPQTSHVFENVSFGNHLVTVKDLNGCMDVSQNVFVYDIPKFFTPNSDGFYDTWHIIGAEQLPGSSLHIFNRYGKLLKTLQHNSPGWDGTYNGQNMPSDDYWFHAEIVQNGNTFDVRGHFALKR